MTTVRKPCWLKEMAKLIEQNVLPSCGMALVKRNTRRSSVRPSIDKAARRLRNASASPE